MSQDLLTTMKRGAVEAAEASYRSGYISAIADVVTLMRHSLDTEQIKRIAAMMDTMPPSPAIEQMKREAGIT